MKAGENVYASYFRIWVWLVALVIVSVVASVALPRSVALLLIFTAAWIKAVLVALHYMHLKYEKWQLCTLVVIPLLLVIGLTFTLFPDIVFRH